MMNDKKRIGEILLLIRDLMIRDSLSKKDLKSLALFRDELNFRLQKYIKLNEKLGQD